MTEQQYQEFADYVDHDNQSPDTGRLTALDVLRAYTQQFGYAGHEAAVQRTVIKVCASFVDVMFPDAAAEHDRAAVIGAKISGTPPGGTPYGAHLAAAHAE